MLSVEVDKVELASIRTTDWKDLSCQPVQTGGCALLEKDRDYRYQHASDLKVELKRLDRDAKSRLLAPAEQESGTNLTRTIILASAVLVILAYALMPTGSDQALEPSPLAGLNASFSQLTSLNGAELYPSFSPDGVSIVYAAEESGNWDIFSRRVDGERTINLTEDSISIDWQPSLSPDGKFIAFHSYSDGGGIFLMGATGENRRKITDFGFNPTWSPDGAKVLFATEIVIDNPFGRSALTGPAVFGFPTGLWTVDVATEQRTQVFEADAVQPVWSPNGHRIAFWAIPPGGGQRDIWTIPAEGGEPVPVMQDAPLDWNPVWSADGEYLYFSSDRAGGMNIWRVPIDERTGNAQGPFEQITTGGSTEHIHLTLDWARNRIAYVESRTNMTLYSAPFDLATGRISGGPQPILTEEARIGPVDVSPDGQWLVYRRHGPGGSILVNRVDGTSRRQLLRDEFRNRGPRWSPDGNKIAFYSDRTGSYEIWIMDSDGSGLEQVTDSPGRSTRSPVWSPDGRSLAYVVDAEQSAVYVLDLGRRRDERNPRFIHIAAP